MPARVFDVPGIGPIAFYKRRGAKSLRLSVNAPDSVRVTLPYWTPYAAGVAFARSKQHWIMAELAKTAATILAPGQAVGKAHHLRFVTNPTAETVTTRLVGGEVVITHPLSVQYSDSIVQIAAQKACVRALKKEAQRLLPQRLETLAERHGYDYKSVTIKQLKRRWGSCDQHRNIVLNLYLMQLPWHLIDYVLLHELTHTHHLNHSAAFWAELRSLMPDLAALRKTMRQYQPKLDVQA